MQRYLAKLLSKMFILRFKYFKYIPFIIILFIINYKYMIKIGINLWKELELFINGQIK